MWRVRGDIVNPAGTLALHLIGNLSQFVGADLGGAAFVRDRASEFARRDVPRADLIAGLREVSARVVSALDGLDAARLDEVECTAVAGFPGRHDGPVLPDSPVRAPELAPGAGGLPPADALTRAGSGRVRG